MRVAATTSLDAVAVTRAAQQACAAIAPSWPLDRSIAVNPYWKLRTESFSSVAEQMRHLAASPMTMPLSYYRRLWDQGTITHSDLATACSETGDSMSAEEMLEALHTEDAPAAPLPLLSDLLDRGRNPLHQTLWREHITTQISQCCASFFDQFQAEWPHDATHSLYQYWRQMVATDRGGALLMGESSWRSRSRHLPQDAAGLLQLAATTLAISSGQLLPWFRVALYRLNGWASWCAYLAWEADLEGRPAAPRLLELLAIRIAWEYLLFDGEMSPGSVWSNWQTAWESGTAPQAASRRSAAPLWLRAHEISYQRGLFDKLRQAATPCSGPLRMQAVFCIDVRSEAMRRHLELAAHDTETIGFAGFFGVPMAYRPLGSQTATPQLPGLIAPGFMATETTGTAEKDATLERTQQQNYQQWTAKADHARLPASAFNLVEAEGPLKFISLWKHAFGRSQQAVPPQKIYAAASGAGLRLDLVANLPDKVEIAARFLEATGLAHQLAPVVLIVGHASQTANNPLASALDCGACCGQSGLVNARVLSGILNDVAVREELRSRNIAIPSETRFLAAVHDTTLDLIALDQTDAARLPPAQAEELRRTLAVASTAAREERASQFPPASTGTSAYAAALRRATDWAELRPEWGLVNNASLIVGPRAKTRAINLRGRSFLHEYDSETDPDGKQLEQILAAPLVVANWINLQYFASCVDPLHFGSGNKTLHNVVGGNIGVFEGNGGDLRIGLARQSLHDGEDWLHHPLRLTAVIFVEPEKLQRALGNQPEAQALVRGGWLYLFAATEGGFVPMRAE